MVLFRTPGPAFALIGVCPPFPLVEIRGDCLASAASKMNNTPTHKLIIFKTVLALFTLKQKLKSSDDEDGLDV